MPNNNARPNATRLGVELLEARTVPATFGADQGLSLAVGDVIPGPLFAGSEYVTGTGPGKLGLVQVFDNQGAVKYKVTPFANYTDGVFVTLGDVNGDGLKDIISSTAAGSTGRVRVYSFTGNQLSDLGRFMPFGANYVGGIELAAANVTGDATDEIVVGKQTTGSAVKVFGTTPSGTGGLSYFQLRKFQAFGANYKGGVSVAAANVDLDDTVAGGFDTTDYAEVIVGRATGSSRLKIFDAQTPVVTTRADYFVFDTNLPSSAFGISVTAGETTGTRGAQIYVSQPDAPFTSTTVRIIDGPTGVPLGDFVIDYPATFGRKLNLTIDDMSDDIAGTYAVTDLYAVAGNGPYLQVPVIFDGAAGSPAGLNGSQAAP